MANTQQELPWSFMQFFALKKPRVFLSSSHSNNRKGGDSLNEPPALTKPEETPEKEYPSGEGKIQPN